MKKIAFTCSACDALNIPEPHEDWKGFAACKQCGSIESVSGTREVKTTGTVYRAFSQNCGLSFAQLIELQKRGVLPRDLSRSKDIHRAIASAVSMALGSEEILRGALAKLPKKRREKLLHPVATDGLLRPWQREVLQKYIGEYERALQAPLECVQGLQVRRRFGDPPTSISAMVTYLETKYDLPASTTHAEVKRLKKLAYNRAQRQVRGEGGSHE